MPAPSRIQSERTQNIVIAVLMFSILLLSLGIANALVSMRSPSPKTAWVSWEGMTLRAPRSWQPPAETSPSYLALNHPDDPQQLMVVSKIHYENRVQPKAVIISLGLINPFAGGPQIVEEQTGDKVWARATLYLTNTEQGNQLQKQIAVLTWNYQDYWLVQFSQPVQSMEQSELNEAFFQWMLETAHQTNPQ